MRTIYWYIYFGVTLLGKMPSFWRAKSKKAVMAPDDYDNLINKIIRKWTLGVIKSAGVTVDIKGLSNIPQEAVLFVANHQSNFDVALLLGCIDKNKGFVAKTEMLKIPFVRDWAKEMKCVFMDRTDIKQSARTILEGIEVLKSGYSMVIFPEGTRSKCLQMGEFKAGSFKLATKSKVKIVPVTISGTYKIMEANNNKICPADVRMVIHPPVDTAGLTREEETALCGRVREIIEKAL